MEKCRDCKHWEPRRGAVGKCKKWKPRVHANGAAYYNYYDASHYACKKNFEPKEEPNDYSL